MIPALVAAVAALGALAIWLSLRHARLLRDLEDAVRICDLANDAVLVADIVDGRVILANPAACRLLGYELADLLQKQLPELHPTEFVHKSAEIIADVWEKKGHVYADLPFLSSGGEQIDVEVSANVISIQARSAVLLHARDIRERKRLEIEVRRLAQFPESNPMPVLRIAAGLEILYENPASKRFCETVGRPDAHIEDALPPDFESTVTDALATERVALQQQYEALGRHLSISYGPLPGGTQLFAMITDQTERVEAERRIRKYADELLETNTKLHDTRAQLVQSEKMAALGSLVAGIAHELNTPIGAVSSNADLAKSALAIVREALEKEDAAHVLAASPRVKKALGILDQSTSVTKEAASRVSTMVKSLRNFARLDEAERKRASLHEGIDSTLTLMHHVLRKGIAVVKRYGAVPDVDCFPNQLNQVFMNVLVNAAQAIEGEGTVTITTTAEDGSAVVRVGDTGSGIAPENVAKVFDPGFTTKGVGVGTGLGLSICFRIIQDHGGTIGVESTPGKGTTFTIRVPIDRAD